MARMLILGGGQRGQRLAADLVGEGHAVRIVATAESSRAAIEALGAEWFVGDPDRLATLRGALEGVAVVCWLLGERHAERLPAFLTSAVDSTVRAFLYEAPPAVAARALQIAQRNALPANALAADPSDLESWLRATRATLDLYL